MVTHASYKYNDNCLVAALQSSWMTISVARTFFLMMTMMMMLMMKMKMMGYGHLNES
jgi:hypothetical protein